MDCGGLATRMPVLGLTMGMALRVRSAEGWWIFICWALVDWKPVEGWYELPEADSEKDGVTWRCGWTGETLGEPLEREDRSDEEEWMDCKSSSVSRSGQNSRSSTSSKPLDDS